MISENREPWWSWQKALIFSSAVLVAAYVTGVLWQVQSVPELGLRCTFRNVVSRYDASTLRMVDGRELPNLTGATIEGLGSQSVANLPQLLRAREALEKVHFAPHDRLPANGPENYVRVDEANWVKTRLRLVESTGALESIWCQVTQTPPATLLPTLLWMGLESAVFAVAAFVFWKRPNDRPARQFFLMTVFVINAFIGGYHWSQIATSPILIVGYIVCGILLPAVSLHFYQLFPRPKPWLDRHPVPTLLFTYGPSVAFLAATVACYAWVRTLVRGNGSDSEIQAALDLLRGVIFTYLVVAAILYLMSVVFLAHSYWTAHGEVERNQVRWIFFGSLLATLPLGYSLYLAVWWTKEFAGGAAMWPMFAASICFALAFTISITRYRLLQLDQLITSGMAYFLVSVLAAAIYYALVFVGTLVMGGHGVTGPSMEQAFWVSGVALVMAVGLDVMRSRLRKALDRRYRRDKSQLDQTLHLLGEAVEQLVDPPALARRLLRAAADLFGVSTGAVYLRDGDPPVFRVAGVLGSVPPAPELSADSPIATALASFETIPPRNGAVSFDALVQLRTVGGAAAVALTHENKLRGVLILGPKTSGNYEPEDLDLLAAFAPFTALALAGAEGHSTIESLNRELQTKVEKISEQQRRIMALQQQLVSQTKSNETSDAKASEELPSAMAAGIIGGSATLRRVLALAQKVAASPSAVLIRGESGTGKGLLAKAIHDNSSRAGRPFVKVHCAALAPGLLESELFGHVKGAFTGAVRDKVGRFEMADGGTLFLDEIGDISLDLQTKLLRVLQEKTFERVGSSGSVQVDVRLVAATHQNLEQFIRQGRFREDLFYRLNVITLSMPSLRDRAEDIPELAQYFLRTHSQKCGKEISQIEDEAIVALRAYHWPGNIRELENAIERAVVVADGLNLAERDLPEEVRRATVIPEAVNAGTTASGGYWGIRSEREVRDRRERESLLSALESSGGNKAEAARLLGMARSTLISRLKKHGLLQERT